jgi:hypothetical protein
VRLPRGPRPTPHRLLAAVSVLGLVAALAFLVMPLEVRFDDDPLLRLQPFSPALEQAVTEVSCGSAVSSLGRRSDELSLAGVARADACRDGATLRAASAVATTAVIGVLALVTLAGSRRREAMA